jgi:hypothetical protein
VRGEKAEKNNKKFRPRKGEKQINGIDPSQRPFWDDIDEKNIP